MTPTSNKTPDKLILRPGVYQSKETKGGLDLKKWFLKILKKIGFADTVDCCVYYPTFPVFAAADWESVSEEELATIPLYGWFITIDPEDSASIFIWIKVADDTAQTLQFS